MADVDADPEDAADDPMVEGWLLRVLLRFAPELPSPSDPPSDATWRGFAAGCMACGCTPIYIGVAACIVVAARCAVCQRAPEAVLKHRVWPLVGVVGALAAVALAGGMAFCLGLSRVARVQESAEEMAVRLSHMERSSEHWLEITRRALWVVRDLLPRCPPLAASRLQSTLAWLEDAESQLAPFGSDLQGLRELLMESYAWWTSRPRVAALGIFPFAVVLLSCVAALGLVRRSRSSRGRALGRLVTLLVVVPSILVVVAASAAHISLDIAAARLCHHKGIPLLLCLRPTLDEATLDICWGYMRPAGCSRSSAVMNRPRRAKMKWSLVLSRHEDHVLAATSCNDSMYMWLVQSLAEQSFQRYEEVEQACHPEQVHDVYTAAVSEICNGLIDDVMTVAMCWLLTGAVLLPALAFATLAYLERCRDPPESGEVELSTNLTSTSGARSSDIATPKAIPWQRHWATSDFPRS